MIKNLLKSTIGYLLLADIVNLKINHRNDLNNKS